MQSKKQKKTVQLKLVVFVIVGLFIAVIDSAQAADFYVDPVGGNMENDGSIDHPWSTMQEVWEQNKVETTRYIAPFDSQTKATESKNIGAPVQPGDTIYLLNGYHGELVISRAVNSDYITIKALDGETPTLGRVSVTSASKFNFEGLTVSPSFMTNPVKDVIFGIYDHSYTGPSSMINVRNSNIFTVPDDSVWITKQDWADNSWPGLKTSANDSVLENLLIYNIHGVTVSDGDNITIQDCTIDKSSADAVRIQNSNHINFVRNTVKNIVTIADYSAYHYDMIQAWNDNDDQVGLNISQNTLIAFEDSTVPFMGEETVQGIGFFDGFYTDFVVENNVIFINGYHGITIRGGRNCKIANNTVVSNTGGSGAPINILDHQNGTAGYDNTIINNFSSSVSTLNGGVVTNLNNITGFVPSHHFINVEDNDATLIASSIAINGGLINGAPTVDILGHPRGEFPDIGAYEYQKSFRSDVDGSSEITTTDALLTLRNSLGLSMISTAWQASATTGDVNCDGVSNSTDALLILRYSLGLSMSETGWCE